MDDKLFGQLMSSLNNALAYSQGDKSRCREAAVEVPDPVPAYKAADVVRTRKELNLTQRRLASALGVSPRTVEAWEAGKNEPSGAARHLLYLFDSDHSLVDRFIPRRTSA